MKFRQFTMPIGCSALGALGLMAALPPQALGDEARTQVASTQHHQTGYDQKKVNELVKIVREATARFRDVAAAEAEQYKLNFGCVTGGDWGAMGLHYVNMPLVLDGNLDATRPEIVIYEPLPNGKLRITGADYLVLADGWDAKKIGPPQLNGSALPSLPGAEPLRSAGVLHAARVGVEGQPDRHVHELASPRFVRRIRRQVT